MIAINDKGQKYIKIFIMGRDEHISTETVNFTFFGKTHIFHIVPDCRKTPRIFTPGNGETFTKRNYKRILITA